MVDIKDYVNSSKYTTWYCAIVAKAATRLHVKGNERHHIVPKSICPEGAKLQSNIVSLTPREHFVCHTLLPKMLISTEHINKMGFALWRLTHKRKQDGAILTGRQYECARRLYITSLKQLWETEKFRAAQSEARAWFYNDPAQKETNRQKALQEMKNPETRKKFVQAGLQACKAVRDADPKAWVTSSMGSEEGRARSKQSCQTEEFRECCKTRELSKSVEDRQKLAKQGQQALVEKCGGEEAYKKMLSDRIKGRKKYVNAEGIVRVLREPLEGFVLLAQKRITNDL